MNHRSGMPYLAGAFFLAGTSVVAAHFVSGRLGPFTVTAASLALALPALLAACGREMAAHIRRMRPADWLPVLLQAVFGMFLFRLFLLNGLRLTSTAEAGILTGATPAATALLAGLFLRERAGWLRAAGIACTVGGVVLLQGVGSSGGVLSAAHLGGNLLVLLAALCESAFNVLSRAGILRERVSEAPVGSPICRTRSSRRQRCCSA